MAEPTTSPQGNARSRSPDLLPNEQEISYDHIHNFFNRNKTWITGICILAVLLAGWMVVSRFQQDQAREEAGQKLAVAMQARSMEPLQQVARDYAETEAGLYANMLMADLWFQQRQYEKAGQCYAEVELRHPESPFTPSAIIGQATILEVTGRSSEAMQKYQLVAAAYPNSFQAPQAVFAAARLLEGGGKLAEARKEYENLVARHPSSSWKAEANARLEQINRRLKSMPPSAPNPG